MLLNDVKNALCTVDERVYYGTASQHSKDAPWDYIVFSRDRLKRSQNRTGFVDRINVAIVREDFIEDDIVASVVSAMEALPGVHLDSGEFEYQYAMKPGTGLTVEMLELRFTHARKAQR